jgi:hypothetical protein
VTKWLSEKSIQRELFRSHATTRDRHETVRCMCRNSAREKTALYFLFFFYQSPHILFFIFSLLCFTSMCAPCTRPHAVARRDGIRYTPKYFTTSIECMLHDVDGQTMASYCNRRFTHGRQLHVVANDGSGVKLERQWLIVDDEYGS